MLRLAGLADGLTQHELGSYHFIRDFGLLDYFCIRFEDDCAESNGALYYIIADAWQNVFGDTEASLRFPSVISGVLSVWAVYVLAGDLGLNKRIAVFSAFFMAISGSAALYSRFLRFYAFNGLMCLCGTIMFCRAVRSSSRRYWLLYYIFMAASIASMLLSVTVYLSHYLIALFIIEDKKKTLCIVARGSVFVCLLLLLAAVLDPMASSRISRYPDLNINMLIDLTAFFLGIGFYHSPFDISAVNMSGNVLQNLAISAVLLVCFAAGFWRNCKNSREKLSAVLVAWICVPLFLMLLSNVLGKQILSMQNCFFILPAFSILLGIGLNSLGKRWRAAALIAIAISSQAMVYDLYEMEGCSFRDAFEYLNNTKKASEPAVISGPFRVDYYLGNNKRGLSLIEKTDVFYLNSGADIKRLHDVLASGKVEKCWLVHTKESEELWSRHIPFWLMRLSILSRRQFSTDINIECARI